MSSFSCPHYDQARERCQKLGAECVPGRAGCVLRHNSKFAVPPEERLRRLRELQRADGSDDAGPSGRASGTAP